ncbi:UNVERIFIED_CONTAM: hypothetical protein Slati_4159500 [Sesamum latifolium]|uniref:Uncharacterized protein n=1 Tax=Sesamum latifolium TaxID=2727402 RepID=A0AAW2TCF2_9LAMI
MSQGTWGSIRYLIGLSRDTSKKFLEGDELMSRGTPLPLVEAKTLLVEVCFSQILQVEACCLDISLVEAHLYQGRAKAIGFERISVLRLGFFLNCFYLVFQGLDGFLATGLVEIPYVPNRSHDLWKKVSLQDIHCFKAKHESEHQ